MSTSANPLDWPASAPFTPDDLPPAGSTDQPEFRRLRARRYLASGQRVHVVGRHGLTPAVPSAVVARILRRHQDDDTRTRSTRAPVAPRYWLTCPGCGVDVAAADARPTMPKPCRLCCKSPRRNPRAD